MVFRFKSYTYYLQKKKGMSKAAVNEIIYSRLFHGTLADKRWQENNKNLKPEHTLSAKYSEHNKKSKASVFWRTL